MLTGRLRPYTIVLAATILITGARTVSAETALELNNQGVQALNGGNFDLAIQKFEAALRVDPFYRLARENLATTFNNYGLKLQGNPKAAIKYFHRAVLTNPGNETARHNLDGIITYMNKNPGNFKDRLQLGDEARREGDPEGAMVEYAAALQLKDDPAVRVKLGEVYRVRDKNKEAIDQFQAVVRMAPSADVYVKLGQAYQANKDLQNAIASYGKALELKSDDPEVVAALKAGFDQAVRMDPLAPENHIGLGQALQYGGDFDQAAAEFKTALTLAQRKHDGNLISVAQRLIDALPVARREAQYAKHIDTGVELQSRKPPMLDLALAEYKKALEIKPDSADAWLNIGTVFQVRHEFDQAISAYNKALQLGGAKWPKIAAAQQGIKAVESERKDKLIDETEKAAQDAFKLGKYKEAVAKYRALLDMTDPKNAATHFNMAAAYQADKDFDSAIAEYKLAIDYSGGKAEYKKALDVALALKAEPLIQKALDLHKGKDYTGAISYYQQALKLVPKNPAWWYNLAGAYYSLEDYLKAREAYKTSLDIGGKDQIDNLYFLAVIDEHFGKGEQARMQYLQYVTQAIGKGKYMEEAKERLKALNADISNTQKIKSEKELAVEKDAEDAVKKAVDLQKAKQWEEAIALYQKALKLMPNEASTAYSLATLFQQKGDYDLAIQWYKNAQGLLATAKTKNPQLEKTIVALLKETYELKAKPIIENALKKHEQKDLVAAIEGYRKALEIVGDNADLWLNLGSALQNTDDFAGARIAYQKSFDLGKKVDNLYLMAAIDEHYGDGFKAMNEYKEYLQKAPAGQYASLAKDRIAALSKDIRATQKLQTQSEIKLAEEISDLVQQGVKAQEARQFDQAVSLYQRAFDKAPKDGTIAYAIGTAYQQKGDMALAVDWYRRALPMVNEKLRKDYEKVLSTALGLKADPIVQEAVKLQQEGKLAESIELYRKALEDVPKAARVWTNLGIAYQNHDDFQLARDAYKKGYDLDPKAEAGNLYLMALVDEHYGKGAEALALYRKYLFEQPAGQYVKVAQERINALAKNIMATERLQTSSERSQLQTARDNFEQAVKLQQENKFDEAIEYYFKALAARPKDPAIHYTLGTAYQQKGDLDNAILKYKEASDIDPKNPDYKKVLSQARAAKAGPFAEEAVKRQTGGDLQGALENYDKALQVMPDDARLWTNRGTALQASDQFDRARADYEKGYKIDPKSEVDNLYLMAAIDEHFGKGAQALQGYLQYRLKAPNGQYIKLAIDRINALQKNVGAVQRLQTQSDVAKAREAESALAEGYKAQQESRFDEALAKYQQALNIKASDPQITFAIGTVYQAKGDLDLAKQWYQKAVGLDPNNVEYKKTLASVTAGKAAGLLDEAVKQHQAGNLVEAIRLYNEGLQVQPDNAHGWTNLGAAYQAGDQFAAARGAYERGYKTDPKGEVDNLYFMAVLDEHFGKGQLAFQEYSQYVQQARLGSYAALANQRIAALKVNVQATNKLATRAEQQRSAEAEQAFQNAVQLQQAGKYDEAVTEYKKALAVAPKNADYWYSLATNYQAKNDPDNAIAAYQEALKLRPNEPTWKQYLKQMKQAKAAPLVESAIKKQTTQDASGKYDIAGAIADYEAALRVDGDDATTHLNLGTAYQAVGNLQKALQEYNRAVQLDKNQTDAHYYSGTVYEAMKQPALATASYKKYVQVAPSGQFSGEAKNRMKILTPGTQ